MKAFDGFLTEVQFALENCTVSTLGNVIPRQDKFSNLNNSRQALCDFSHEVGKSGQTQPKNSHNPLPRGLMA